MENNDLFMYKYDVYLEVFTKGSTQDIANMRERLFSILKNRSCLNDANWLRNLFGEEFFEIDLHKKNKYYGNLDEDGRIIFEFHGFSFTWDVEDIKENHFSFIALNRDYPEWDMEDAEDFVRSLKDCFPHIKFYFIRTAYQHDPGHYLAFQDGFDAGVFDDNWEAGNGAQNGKQVYDAYKIYKNAVIVEHLLLDSASEEERLETKQKLDFAATIFCAFEYAYQHLLTEEKTLSVGGASFNGSMFNIGIDDYFGDAVSEKILSVIYDHFHDIIETIDFNCWDNWSCEDPLPKLPENIVSAIKSGKVTLVGYN